MSLNNDFSFVRFLKVVKTLYESSVFTKIGKTVGSELDKQLPTRDDETAIETIESEDNVPLSEKYNVVVRSRGRANGQDSSSATGPSTSPSPATWRQAAAGASGATQMSVRQ